MYAIVEIAGQQIKVDNDGAVKVGTPVVEGAKVTASVVEHVRGEKVLVFKKKRRKGYQKMNGHRQYLTKIQIEEVIG
jgi:large subunit ribosomal protein L21